MGCIKHHERGAVNTCCHCGNLICAECSVDIRGRVYCSDCVAFLLDGRGRHCHAKRHHSGFLLFITSCILPGLGYMYLGLIKRGLFFLSAFFLTAYAAASWGMTFAGILIPIMWITSFFDGFNKLRSLNAGEYVEDTVEDILGFVRRNKKVVYLFLIVLLLGWFLNAGIYAISRILPYSIYPYQFKKFIPLLLVVVGIYILFSKKKHHHHHHHHNDDSLQ